MFVTLLLVTVITLICTAIYHFFTRRLQYWNRKNIPYSKPIPTLINFFKLILFKKHVSQITHDLCKKFPNAPLIGTFYGTEPALVIQDPNLIKLVMTKDFSHFMGRENTQYVEKDEFARNIFFLAGDQWKSLRQNISPLFSTAKMKNMFHLIQKCSHVLGNILNQEVKDSDEIEARAFMARFTMDCIGSCAFGVNTNTMDKKEDNPFTSIGLAIFFNDRLQALKHAVRALWPAIFYGLRLKTFPESVETFFRQLMKKVFEGRQHKVSTRNDFVDLVLRMKSNQVVTKNSDSTEKVHLEMTEDVLASQCFAFFAAGYETSATTLSYTLYELAKHPEAQNKVLEEVDAYLRRHDNVLTYECVSELPYVEACFDEALRLYPILPLPTREVTEDYVFPNGLKVEKGLRIHVPVPNLHYNPDYFPEPQQYRPERFLGEQKRNIKPYTYMAFGVGQRNCVGARFAKMQMTAGLITLLKKYRLELAEGMTRNVLVEPKSFLLQPVGGIKLKLIQRDGWEHRVLQCPKDQLDVF